MRILIVEDEVSNRLMLSECLREVHKTDVAVNGQEAVLAFQLAHMENDPYQAVLLDVELPGVLTRFQSLIPVLKDHIDVQYIRTSP